MKKFLKTKTRKVAALSISGVIAATLGGIHSSYARPINAEIQPGVARVHAAHAEAKTAKEVARGHQAAMRELRSSDIHQEYTAVVTAGNEAEFDTYFKDFDSVRAGKLYLVIRQDKTFEAGVISIPVETMTQMYLTANVNLSSVAVDMMDPVSGTVRRITISGNDELLTKDLMDSGEESWGGVGAALNRLAEKMKPASDQIQEATSKEQQAVEAAAKALHELPHSVAAAKIAEALKGDGSSQAPLLLDLLTHNHVFTFDNGAAGKEPVVGLINPTGAGGMKHFKGLIAAGTLRLELPNGSSRDFDLSRLESVKSDQLNSTLPAAP